MIQSPSPFCIAIAQLNPIVGDVAGNLAKARAARDAMVRIGAHLIVFPELFISGYPLEDLVLKPSLQQACRQAVEEFAKDTSDLGPAVLVGTPWIKDGKLYNAAAFLDDGAVKAVQYKVDLPNYGVFDEKRVFNIGDFPVSVNIRGVNCGILICEDLWNREDITDHLKDNGAQLLIVINSSPYWQGKPQERIDLVRRRVAESGMPLLYVNQVGGQDELVFDGGSFAMNADGKLKNTLPVYKEAIELSYFCRDVGKFEGDDLHFIVQPADEANYAACVLGLRDYIEKNRFSGIVLGLSGGIDSAICAAMAVDAIGPERVHAVMLPYQYTSQDSLADARECADALCIRYDVLPIVDAVQGLESSLSVMLSGRTPDATEENIQSRARGVMLMALSNASGKMVLTTGNKSEMSVGYATLYGDMNGGFNPIKDLYKTEVYRLSALRNRWKPADALGPDGVVIPPRIITKEPTAELRENQRDQDSLPPYEVLDAILERLVERDMSTSSIIAEGFDAATVLRVEHLLYLAEYKRRQAAPGVKISSRNFGRDRRYPITNRFRDTLS